jgi:hypothetical protein
MKSARFLVMIAVVLAVTAGAASAGCWSDPYPCAPHGYGFGSGQYPGWSGSCWACNSHYVYDPSSGYTLVYQSWPQPVKECGTCPQLANAYSGVVTCQAPQTVCCR